jgi:REP element-mobilizing transposase RayT
MVENRQHKRFGYLGGMDHHAQPFPWDYIFRYRW